MELYTILREFADSWILVVFVAFIIGVGIWVIRPGSWEIHADAANIPFRNDTAADVDDNTTPDRGDAK